MQTTIDTNYIAGQCKFFSIEKRVWVLNGLAPLSKISAVCTSQFPGPGETEICSIECEGTKNSIFIFLAGMVQSFPCKCYFVCICIYDRWLQILYVGFPCILARNVFSKLSYLVIRFKTSFSRIRNHNVSQ